MFHLLILFVLLKYQVRFGPGRRRSRRRRNNSPLSTNTHPATARCGQQREVARTLSRDRLAASRNCRHLEALKPWWRNNNKQKKKKKNNENCKNTTNNNNNRNEPLSSRQAQILQAGELWRGAPGLQAGELQGALADKVLHRLWKIGRASEGIIIIIIIII